MDPGDLIPVVGVLLLAGTTAIAIGGAYAIGRGRRREREIPAPSADSSHERLDHVERMIEAMSIEVERISEGQRFLVKVMGERLPSPADKPRSPERVITPH